MVRFLQWLLGLDPEDARYISYVIASVAGMMTVIFTPLSFVLYRWGQIQGWRDARRGIDRDTLRCLRFILEPNGNGELIFAVETGAVASLRQVFGNQTLERLIGRCVGEGEPGDTIPPEGRERYRSLRLVRSFISGNSEQASQSAMFGRYDDYHRDMTAIMLTWVHTDYGEAVPAIFQASPEFLERALDEKYVDDLPMLRTVYALYKPILKKMAKLFAESNAIFANEPDQRIAGEKAAVWLARNRTPKTGLQAEEIRRIVRQEVAAVLKAGSQSS